MIVPLLIPFPSTVAPEWKVTVLNLSNEPVVGIQAKQYWRHYTLEASDNYEEKTTDENGQVLFEKRVIWRNALMWLLGGLGSVMSTGVHASFGPVSGISARHGCEIGSVTYIPSIELKHTLILNDRMTTKECS